MKKHLFIGFSALVIFAMLMLAGCGTTATEAPKAAAPAAPAAPAAKPILAVSLPALDNPLMLGFKDAFTGAFSDKYDVQVASADGNPNTQSTQVENFTTQKAKFLFVMPAEATSLVPKLIAARKAGVSVLVAGGDPGNAEAYDAVMMMNQFLSGSFSAWAAKQWVDATYADAPDGSVETAILESTLNPDAVARTTGLKMIAEPHLKNVKGEYVDAAGKVVTEANKVANPAFSSKVKIVTTTQAEMFQAGQTAMQNILTTNPNVKLVIAYAGDGGMGASQAIIDEFNKGPNLIVIKDLNKVAVFSVGMIGPEGVAVLDSATNKTVFRGTIQFGGDLVGRTIEYAMKMLAGEKPGVIYDPLVVVTAVDGKLSGLAVEETEFFKVPTGKPFEVKLGPPPK